MSSIDVTRTYSFKITVILYTCDLVVTLLSIHPNLLFLVTIYSTKINFCTYYVYKL